MIGLKSFEKEAEVVSYRCKSKEEFIKALKDLPTVEEGFTRDILPASEPRTACFGLLIFDLNSETKETKGIIYYLPIHYAKGFSSLFEMNNEFNKTFDKYFSEFLKEIESSPNES